MPRPKRTKVAPAPRAHKPAAANPVRKVKEDTVESEDLYGVSDQENRPAARAKRTKTSHPNESATRKQSTPRPLNTTMALTREQNQALEGQRTRRGRALQRLDAENSANTSPSQIVTETPMASQSSPEVEHSRREQPTPAIDTSVLVAGNFRRRPRQPSILGRAAPRARSDSLGSDLSDAGNLTSLPGNTTPAVGALGKRQRQPSILGQQSALRAKPSIESMNAGMETPGNVGSALKFGAFRRRPRQPSILGTAQKIRQQISQSDEEESEDEFDPIDGSARQSPSNRPSSVQQGQSSPLNPRKRKLSQVQVPRSPPPAVSTESDHEPEIIPATASGTSRDESEPPQSSPAEPQVQQPAAPSPGPPDRYSETMAPPRSSSSPAPPSPVVIQAARRANNQRAAPVRRQPARRPATPSDPPSSPPSLTHSPNGPYIKKNTKNARQAPPAPKTLSTAQLQALLPRRRRQQPRDAFDFEDDDASEVDLTGLASDDDELSHLGTTTARRPNPRQASRTPAPRRAANTAAKGKAKATLKPKPKTPGASTRKTYGGARTAASTSDKANAAVEEADEEAGGLEEGDSLGPIPDDEESPENSEELEARVGQELKKAARKFKEVDEWELEFEEATQSSSSPRDAR